MHRHRYSQPFEPFQLSKSHKVNPLPHLQPRASKASCEFVFAPQVSMGNFQGLRTASFWLSYMAWSVSGLTIRRAMEFQLGKAFDFVVGASAIEKGFDRQLDQWMMAWTGQYRSHERTGNFLLKALTLHYHFAKLFVSSHVFRGRSSHGGGEPVPPEYSDIAQVAVSSASAIVKLIINDVDIRAAFVGMSHYCHTMIAYACFFLPKLATS
ncbi:hypothetical protein CSUB01_11094 [Colletotrichum sublineola]|uniref:Uncharacterized protein n=1 Tax=Colletotrichum sublineola TaxID=1173701 RepID=A0A066XHQ4_COLSU|nr:hypothetical protein CSUB01_11094 [Colletotrichum sublineola]